MEDSIQEIKIMVQIGNCEIFTAIYGMIFMFGGGAKRVSPIEFAS